MSTTYQDPHVAQEIQRLLTGLRRRIRVYVWIEGLVTLLLWLALTFWVGLLIDYSPVLVWASELPWLLRAVGLAAVAGVAVWIVYERIIRRAFARLADRSMAVVLERRYQQFGDSLLTSVELGDLRENEELTSAMLQSTRDSALQHVGRVRLGEVFNLPPLYWKSVGLLLLAAPMVAFYAWTPELFQTWVDRMYRLSDEPWPRNALVEVVGIQLQRPAAETGQQLPDTLVEFQVGKVKVARGASIKLRVRADAGQEIVPEYCTIYYRADDGSRGSVNMQKIGRIQSGYQQYSYDGKPFKGMLASMRFDVVGFDHRVRDHRIEIVESPAVVQTTLSCTFPDYLVDQATQAWTPRDIAYRSSGVQLPQGAQVVVKCSANKPLKEAHVLHVESGKTIQARMSDGNQFEFPVSMDGESVTLDIVLQDIDNVLMDKPQRLSLTAVQDEPPQVEVNLRGIGSAVTPEVLVPVAGAITDDYLVDRSWFEVFRNDQQNASIPFALGKEGAVSASLDFRQLRGEEGGLRLEAGDKLFLTIQAADRYNLAGDPNVGKSDRFQIDVVTPDELLATLERRELGMRRRFEQVIDEVGRLRDGLLRIRGGIAGEQSSGDDPADQPKQADDPADPKKDAANAEQLALDLRLIRIQQSGMQSQKSGQEILGIASGFRDIREELINNRVDTEDRKSRLKEFIADPMEIVGQTMFPELDRRLAVLEKQHQLPDGREASEAAIAQANDILVELNEILQAMIDIESFNELIELVRTLIDEQEDLLKKTDEQRKKNFFDLLD